MGSCLSMGAMLWIHMNRKLCCTRVHRKVIIGMIGHKYFKKVHDGIWNVCIVKKLLIKRRWNILAELKYHTRYENMKHSLHCPTSMYQIQ